MKHHDRNRKFGRPRNQRKALLASLIRALVLHDRIETTLARAKEVRPRVEKLITKGRNATLAARRAILSELGGDKETADALVKTVAPRYKERAGGYTRIVKTAPRKGDASPMAIIELV